MRATWTGVSAPETAVGGSAVIAPKFAVAAPAPVRSGGRLPGSPAAISAARSWCGLRSGRCWESLAARTATRAAATALPPTTTAVPPTPTVRALPSAARSGLGRPPAVGPCDVFGEIRATGGASDAGPRLVSPKLMSVPGLAFRSCLAASPVTPTTGPRTGPRPSRAAAARAGAAMTTALGADRRRGRGLGGRIRARLDDHDLAADAGQRLAERRGVGAGDRAGGLAGRRRIARQHGGLGELLAAERERRSAAAAPSPSALRPRASREPTPGSRPSRCPPPRRPRCPPGATTSVPSPAAPLTASASGELVKPA